MQSLHNGRWIGHQFINTALLKITLPVLTYLEAVRHQHVGVEMSHPYGNRKSNILIIFLFVLDD